MEKEQVLNPSESLELISDIINKTKENIKEHSFSYLLWGWSVAAASLVSFLLLFSGVKLFFLPFPILAVLSIMINLWFYYKQKRGHATETYLSHFLTKLWLVVGGTFFVIVFVSVSQQIAPFTYTIILGGIGTLISGMVMRYTPLIVGGIVFFFCAVVSVYLSLEYKILLQGLAIITGNLIPGYLLKYSK